MSDRSSTNPGAQPPPGREVVLKQVLPREGAAGVTRNFQVDRPAFVVGAGSRVHLALSSPLVSRSHALIVCDGSEIYLRDLGSRNHVFVNGKVACESDLRPADLVRIGPYEFRCEKGFTRSHGTRAPAGGGGGAMVIRDCGGEATRRVRIMNRTLLIGRRACCEVALPEDESVGAVHAVVFRRTGRYFIRDLYSKCGTFVNGRQVREAELNEGDQIRVGQTAMRYWKGREAATSAKRKRPRGSEGPRGERAWRGPQSLELRGGDEEAHEESGGWGSVIFASGEFDISPRMDGGSEETLEGLSVVAVEEPGPRLARRRRPRRAEEPLLELEEATPEELGFSNDEVEDLIAAMTKEARRAAREEAEAPPIIAQRARAWPWEWVGEWLRGLFA